MEKIDINEKEKGIKMMDIGMEQSEGVIDGALQRMMPAEGNVVTLTPNPLSSREMEKRETQDEFREEWGVKIRYVDDMLRVAARVKDIAEGLFGPYKKEEEKTAEELARDKLLDEYTRQERARIGYNDIEIPVYDLETDFSPAKREKLRAQIKAIEENPETLKILPHFPFPETKYAENEQTGTMSDGEGEAIVVPKIGSLYYDFLAEKESSNNYKRKLEKGGGIGAIGKYQFRTPAFKETGYMDKQGKWSGKDNIKSVEDFINNPEVQDKAAYEFTKKNYGYLKHYNVLSMIGLTIEGLKENFQITLCGMLAASHKEGGPMTAKYLNSLEKNKKGMYYFPYQKYKENQLGSFKAIETRLREFSIIKID